jgi:hypothetical protein
MPDTPPVVTASSTGAFPFGTAGAPFVVAAAEPFIPAPVGEEEGNARSDAWMLDMGKESEDGETKTFACAAVVGRDKDSILHGSLDEGKRARWLRGRWEGDEKADERRGMKWTTAEAAEKGQKSKNDCGGGCRKGRTTSESVSSAEDVPGSRLFGGPMRSFYGQGAVGGILGVVAFNDWDEVLKK